MIFVMKILVEPTLYVLQKTIKLSANVHQVSGATQSQMLNVFQLNLVVQIHVIQAEYVPQVLLDMFVIAHLTKLVIHTLLDVDLKEIALVVM